MKRVLRYLVLALLGAVVSCAALFAYFLYVPEVAQPVLSGRLAKGTIEVGGLRRAYTSYVPKGLPGNAPLVVVMHGSGENAAQIRSGTGYGFERLADRHGFAVVYPESFTFDWNDCSTVGEFTAQGKPVDDLGFLAALTDRLAGELQLDRSRIFATGVSAGGSMAIRLALDAPARFRAVAAVAANVPRADNFKCTPDGQSAPVMLMNGTQDPLVPFDGGEVNLLGMFFKAGQVLSARESAAFFARRNGLAGAPASSRTQQADGVAVERVRYPGTVEVELVAIHGGGHSLPQPYRRPRLLGPSPLAPDGAQMIWDFFARQPQRPVQAG